MGISSPLADSIWIIYLQPVRNFLRDEPNGFSAPWSESLDNISLYTLKIQGMKPMVLSAPWADYKNKQLFINNKI